MQSGGGGTPNIFDQAQNRGRQESSTMPEGMPSHPPRGATDPSRNQQSQQRQQYEQQGGTGYQQDPNDNVINGNGDGSNNQGGSLLDKYRSSPDNGQQSNGNNQRQQSSTGSSDNGNGGQQQQQQSGSDNNQQSQDYFNLGADHYASAFGQRNFLDGIDKQKISAALEGDADAFTEVINAAVRNGATSSSFLSQQVAKRGSQGLLDGFRSELPDHVRKQQINDMWQSNKKSLMQDPAMRPVAEAILQQVQSKNPNATPAEINAEAEQYLQEAFGAIGGNFADSANKEEDNDDSNAQDMSSVFDFN